MVSTVSLYNQYNQWRVTAARFILPTLCGRVGR